MVLDDIRLQQRIQRYGWDRAARTYESLWQANLAEARSASLQSGALREGERVLDVACGTGLVTFEAAHAVGASGEVLGVDLSGGMIEEARLLAAHRRLNHVHFRRMPAESLALPDEHFDAALCVLGLMYSADPLRALHEMRRCLRPGGRVVIAVWGGRSSCGWSPVFPIVDAEVHSEVCPLFFSLGAGTALFDLCMRAGFDRLQQQRLAATLHHASADEACAAAFIGGPVALAWSRFDAVTRTRVTARYLQAIEPWRSGSGYAVPGEFVVVTGVRDASH